MPTYVYVVMRKGHAEGHEWAEESIFAVCTEKGDALDLVPEVDREQYKLMRYRDGTSHPCVIVPWNEPNTNTSFDMT